MLRLDLTMDEQAVLAELLEAQITELRAEIHSTDKREYKEMLKQRERILKDLQVRIGAPKAEALTV
jgi:hypothetical protein